MREKQMRIKLLKLLRTAPYIEGKVSFETLIDHLLANGVTIQKWIPVTERLPEPFEDVIISTKPRTYTTIGYMTRHREWVGVPMSMKVTHWQPLPEAPKEGEG